MERIKCPLCSDVVVVAHDADAFGIYCPVILWHVPGPAAVLSQRDVRRSSGSVREGMWAVDSACLGSGLEPAFARGVAAERAAGRHLRPCP